MLKLFARCAIILVSLSLLSLPAQARDTRHMYPLADALNHPQADEKLNDVKLYFGNSEHPKVVKTMGEFMTNKKTNAFNKSDKEACEWAFLSAMISLQERAVAEGGNAVINIKSYYKKNQVISETEYECGAGAFVAGVTFKGTVVKLAE